VDAVDLVLGYDDFSSDNSSDIFESMGGILVGRELALRFVNGEEKDIRSLLFKEAKKLGATHFLCIDADEFLSDVLKSNFRQYCKSLESGQKLLISWVNLANHGLSYYTVDSPFPPTLKDFVVADSPDLSYSKGDWAMHFDRTPSSNKGADPVIAPSNGGAILHMQHLDQALYELKQAKYKCLELTKTGVSPFQINENTRFTLATSENFQDLPVEYRFMGFQQTSNEWAINDTLSEIYLLFDQFGLLYFEKLEIWRALSLQNYFTKKTGRFPRNFYHLKFLRRVKLKSLALRNKIAFLR
jgi:hypothetical protein